MDGCFDMMHYGHANALRQVRTATTGSCWHFVICQHIKLASVVSVARSLNNVVQAKALGDQLVVGLIPDSEILRCKGPPVMDEEERRIMIDSVKWVGQVITGKSHMLSYNTQEQPVTSLRSLLGWQPDKVTCTWLHQATVDHCKQHEAPHLDDLRLGLL